MPASAAAALGRKLDALWKAKQERLEIDRRSKALKVKERALEDELIRDFSTQQLDGGVGKLCTASVTTRTFAHVKDWDALRLYVVKESAWDLLRKEVIASAYKERLDEGVLVPGVEPFDKKDLSLRARKAERVAR